MKKTFQFLFLITIIFLLYNCRKDTYHYLSENDKKYLFYDIGDTLFFIDKNDTLLGYVSEKDLSLNPEKDYFSKRTSYFEEGILRIVKLGDFSKDIACLYLFTTGNTSEITYKFDTKILNRTNDSCNYNSIEFRATLKNGELVEYSNDEGKYINLVPISTDTYEIFGTCRYQRPYKLNISKSYGMSLIFFNEADSLIIKKL